MKEHAIWHVFCFHKSVNLSLYENASALRGLEQYQNVIANNIAASHVAGFKKVAVSFEAVEGGEIARSTHDRLRNEMPGSFPVMKNQVDYNEGEMKETSNPMDLALRGDGFFALVNQNGDSVYTRDIPVKHLKIFHEPSLQF